MDDKEEVKPINILNNNAEMPLSEENTVAPQPQVREETTQEQTIDLSAQKIEEKYLHFINKNYTPEQRAEILQTLKQNDKGEIIWKDGEDFIKLSLDENGRLRKGVLHDSKEKGAYSELQFKLDETDYKLKATSYDSYDGKTKSSEKSRTDGDVTVVTTRDSNFNSISLVAQKEVEKSKTVYYTDEDGNTTTTSQRVSSSTTTGTPLGVKYEKESLKVNYDNEGNVASTKRKKVGANAILGTELSANKSTTNTNYENGEVAAVHKTNVGVELHRTGISLEGSTQTMNYDENGNMDYTQRGASLNLRVDGYINTGVNVASAHETTDENGSKERREQSLNFKAGTRDLGASSLRAETHTDENGNSERVVKTAGADLGLGHARVESHTQTITNGEEVNKTGMALNFAGTSPKNYVENAIYGTDYTLNRHEIGDHALRKELAETQELATTLRLQARLPNNYQADAQKAGLNVTQYQEAEKTFNQAVDLRDAEKAKDLTYAQTLSPAVQAQMQSGGRN